MFISDKHVEGLNGWMPRRLYGLSKTKLFLFRD